MFGRGNEVNIATIAITNMKLASTTKTDEYDVVARLLAEKITGPAAEANTVSICATPWIRPSSRFP